jgi:hypothetical protein
METLLLLLRLDERLLLLDMSSLQLEISTGNFESLERKHFSEQEYPTVQRVMECFSEIAR